MSAATETKPRLSLPRKRNWLAWALGLFLGFALLINGALAWRVMTHLDEICVKLGGSPYFIGCTYRDATAPAPRRPSPARRSGP